MNFFKNLYSKTKKIASIYGTIFITIMFLNQLLFFGLCLNPVCLIAAMPHVLFITIVIGTWWYRPNWRKLKQSLYSVRESYDEVKANITSLRHAQEKRLFTGDIYLFVTDNKSKGEEDFKTIIERHYMPNIVSIVRMNNVHEEKALLVALKGSEHLFKAGDIIAVVRGGGDIMSKQFAPYKDEETCRKIRSLADENGVITISGVGHSSDYFPIEKAVNFAQITPTDAASQAVYLINGGKW